MSAQRHHRHRTAVALVTGVVDELVVDAEGEPVQELQRVVRFGDDLGATVEPAVAEDEAQAAVAEIVGVRIAELIGDEGDADSLCGDTGAAFGFGERERFRGAVVPSEPRKQAGLAVHRQRLLEVQRESESVTRTRSRSAGGGDVGPG